jgi:hypothetical protein
MPPQPHRPASLEWQVFRGTHAIRRGLLTAHHLRSSAWIRLAQDVYADARLELDHGLFCRAIALRLPEGVVISGPSAAFLYGIEHAARINDPVCVTTRPGVRVQASRRVNVHVNQLEPQDIASDSDPSCVSVTRAAWDVASWLPLEKSVPILDAMLNRALITPADLDALTGDDVGRRGRRQCRTAFSLVDPAARDPRESQFRVRLILAGVPAPALQPAVRLENGAVVTPDMAWPQHRVAIEYSTPRTGLLTASGWLVIHVPSDRMRRDFPAVLAQVQQALVRRDLLLAQQWQK